ncbi:hypothetical protein V5799_017645 [Amblyomma americanum]|uniref:Peptidase M13 C-terminal domain-containing protein n=1 Tax=Amblyomma americanum TaxID=6943 RepID=A0AAQ4F2M3_AMBAM
MSGRKTTTTTWYQEDDLFAKGALFALVAGVVTLLVLFFGSNFSDRDTVKPVARAAGAGVVSVEAANATMASRRPPPFRQRTTVARTKKTKKKPKTSGSKPHRRESEGRLVSRLLEDSVDDGADPCFDLRAHVCSGYGASSVLEGRPLEERAAEEVQRGVAESFRRAVRSPKLLAQHVSLRKAAGFYRSCVDTNPRNPKNVKAIAAFFKHNDLPLLKDADEGSAGPDFLDKTIELQLRYDLRLFFELKADAFPGPGEGTRFIRVAPNAEFADLKKRRAAMKTRREQGHFAKGVLLSCGVDGHRAKDLASRIWTLEKKLLVKTSGDGTDDDDSVEESWKTSLEAHSSGAFMADFELDISSEAAAFFNHMRSRQGVSDSGRALFIAWEACRRLVNVSSPAIGHASRCLALTNADYGHVVRAPYLFSVLTESRLAHVKTMIGNVVREVIASISNTVWVPHSVRVSMEKKVRRMRWMLGYAPRLDHWSGLDRFYRGYPSATGVFAADYLGSRQERMRRYLESLHSQDTDSRLAFQQPPAEPTYTAPNRVALPAASMLPPLFDPRGLAEFNYGLLGSVLLRAMMRAFDGENVEYDGADRVAWSPGRLKEFNERWAFHLSREIPRSGVLFHS